jgi:hypothetical protein
MGPAHEPITTAASDLPGEPGMDSSPFELHRSGRARLIELLRRTGAPDPTPVSQQRRCKMCGEWLGEIHPHLWELEARRMICSCRRCDRLFERTLSRSYRRLQPHVQALPSLQLSDGIWNALAGPEPAREPGYYNNDPGAAGGLAFFFRVSLTGAVMAGRPGPDGVDEEIVDQEAWATLTDRNPVLADLESDVEALLVSRLGLEPEHYRVSIDHGYRLVGLVRNAWSGDLVPTAVKAYFTALRQGV